MSTKITRKYNLSDGILLAHIGKVSQTLPSDLPTIELDFPMINQAFLDGLLADHTNALAEGGDDVAKGEVGQQTQILVAEMENSKRITKRLRFWVGEAFGNNPAKRKAFNFEQVLEGGLQSAEIGAVHEQPEYGGF